jgi:hypothetical protein
MNSVTRYYLLGIFILSLYQGSAQTHTVSGGGSVKNNKGSMTYTIGGIFSEVTASSGYSSYQPIQKPFELFLMSKVDTKDNFIIYPNPTKDVSFIVEKNFVVGNLTCIVMDFSGRILEKVTSSSNKTQIDFSAYPSGTYILNINKRNKKIGVYKILKY